MVRPLLPGWLPHAGRIGKAWTFAYPLVWRSLNCAATIWWISSSAFAAHQIKVRPDAKHLCYCHSPPRFLYGLPSEMITPGCSARFHSRRTPMIGCGRWIAKRRGESHVSSLTLGK